MQMTTNFRKKTALLLFLLFFILFTSSYIFILNLNQSNHGNSHLISDNDNLKTPKEPVTAAQESLTAVWFQNPTLDSPVEPTWYSEIEGDLSDVKTIAGSGHANLSVIGDSGEMRIDEALSNNDWQNFTNPDLPITPQFYDINSSGLHVSHLWNENVNQTHNRPSIHWKRTVTMPVNMSDYVITSASLQVIFNATVTTSPAGGGGIDRTTDGGLTDYSTGDYTEFYALLSDDEESFPSIQVAYNNTGELGQDSPAISSYPDTPMDVVPESVLINVLTSILRSDDRNFTITLGIDIYCEDNIGGADLDRWDALIIRSFNLTFTYEKKIDQMTTMSWNQDGDKISDISNDTIIINEAKLNFKYKIDKNWTFSSPNSEIRAFINHNSVSGPIKLSKANSTFQFAKLGGFDVTSLIPYNVEINISIQVYIADEFGLGQNVSITIDDIYLNISYTVIFPDTQTNLEVFFNGINKTLNPIIEVSVNTDLNITVKYPDNTGSHISGAIVQLSGNLTGTLIENETLEQYTIIINTNNLNIGNLHFDIVAHRINYEARKISPLLIVTKIPTEDLQLFLNYEDKTNDPHYDIAVNKLLNITVKYTNTFGDHISGATIELMGEGILEQLNESILLQQYSIVINTTVKLGLGEKDLIIRAQEENYQEKTIEPRLIVRKINAQITPVSGSNTIDIIPGESVTIKVFINDTDFNAIVKGAIVTYTWDIGDGILSDEDNNGIYEGTIENIPQGTHSIIISAFGSNIYSFENYEIIIIATFNPAENVLLFQVLLTIGIIASVALGGYVYAYQKVLKYPKPVRKVRKFRRTLKKTKVPHIEIKSRDKAFSNAYNKQTGNIMKLVKGKPSEGPKIKKIEKKAPTKPQEKVTNKNVKTKSNINNELNKPSTKQKYSKSSFKMKLRNFWNKTKLTNKSNKFTKFSIVFIFIILNVIMINQFINLNSINSSNDSLAPTKNENNNLIGISGQNSFTTQWLNNTSLDYPNVPSWYSDKSGDISDVEAKSGLGNVNMSIIGDTGVFNVDDPLTDTIWLPFNNPEFPISPGVGGTPINGSSQAGLYITHEWNEGIDQTRNTPSIHWKRNITMPINMSDYIITAASLEVIFNATVTAEGAGQPHIGGIEVPGDYTEGQFPLSGDTQFGIGDFATFYVQISDLNNDNTYQIARNRTTNLGQDSNPGPEIYNHTDTPMDVIAEDLLISYLTSVLEQDYFNFTITLGIDIYCEDNEWNVDIDTWDNLTIRSFNLTFTYEKKIDQFTSVSWNQDADKISDLSNDTVVVDEAILNFKYKIDRNWTNSSPNSEIRILFNDNQHPETVKLSTANGTFQEAKPGGFDVTALIIDEVNLSIQVYLADEFSLDRNITISIDDVTLNISYTIIFPDFETDLHLFLNTENKTDYKINVGEQLNITIKYLNNTGAHIPNATVLLSGNFTGTLVENDILEQYSIIIDTDIGDIGINFLTVSAKLEDYELKIIYPIITVNKLSTDNLQIFLNMDNLTLDPSIELVYGEDLNITIKYADLNGFHIPNATVRLISEGVTRDLNESLSLEQFTLILNTTERLVIGVNLLTIEAQEPNFLTGYAFLRVTVRKVNVEIGTLTGSNTVEIRTGNDVTIRVNLKNTDFEGLITGAIVTYTWENGDGILTDANNDGVYETTLKSFPNGTYTFEVSAFAGDEYFIEDYALIIIGISETAGPPIFQILALISAVIIAGLASYLYVYQKYLRFPKAVRKVRKYRKSLKRKTVPSPNIIGREKAINSLYKEELHKTSNILKVKPPVSRAKGSLIEKLPPRYTQVSEPKKLKLETDTLIDKSLEKKAELDKLVNDTLENGENS